MFNFTEAFTKLALKVKADPEYLKILEKTLSPVVYRGFCVWLDLDKTEAILSKISRNPEALTEEQIKKQQDALTKVCSIHEQTQAEISSIEDLIKK